jgi:hypothetical protein
METTALGAVGLCVAVAVLVTSLILGELSFPLPLPRRLRALQNFGFLGQLLIAALLSTILIAAMVLLFDFGTQPRSQHPQPPAPGSGRFGSLDQG